MRVPLCGLLQIFSDIVFAEKNFMDGNFSKEGFEYYLRLRAQMLALLPVPHVVL
jgi:deoxyadenosine/deoxycytidine kinase